MPSSYLACCPRSLTTPAGITFLDHRQRVSRSELERRDARWRALRERGYARHWADDATLVGSLRSYGESGSLHFRAGAGRGGGGVVRGARPRRLTTAAWKKLLEALRHD